MLPIRVITFGIQGLSGPGILSGEGAPTSETGRVCGFYINKSTWDIYGPKTAEGWGDPQSLLASITVAGGYGRFTHEGTNYKFPVFEDIP